MYEKPAEIILTTCVLMGLENNSGEHGFCVHSKNSLSNKSTDGLFCTSSYRTITTKVINI